MRNPKWRLFHLLLILVVGFVICHIPVWLDDAEARRNKSRVNELISVGQDVFEARKTLHENGFRFLRYTHSEESLSQEYLRLLVVVGDTQHNAFDSLAYSGEFRWMPFTRRESPYVKIDIDEGRIIRIQ